MRSTQDKAILAAHNNADLCGAIMAASGVSTERDELVYFCIDTPLPYYPKIVTLEPSSSSELNYRVRGHSGIKDSFSCLDRDALDLRIAFEASWIWADAGPENNRQNGLGSKVCMIFRTGIKHGTGTIARWIK